MWLRMTLHEFLKYFPASMWKVDVECKRRHWTVTAQRTAKIEITNFPLDVVIGVQVKGLDAGTINVLGIEVWETLTNGPFEFTVDALSDEEARGEEGIVPLGVLWPVVRDGFDPTPNNPLFTAIIPMKDKRATQWFDLWKTLANTAEMKSLVIVYCVELGLTSCEATIIRDGKEIGFIYDEDSKTILIWPKGKEPYDIVPADERKVKAFLLNPGKFLSTHMKQ